MLIELVEVLLGVQDQAVSLIRECRVSEIISLLRLQLDDLSTLLANASSANIAFRRP